MTGARQRRNRKRTIPPKKKMNRRSFLGKFVQAAAGIAFAAHLDFCSLVPIPEKTALKPLMYVNLEPFVQPLYDFYSIARNEQQNFSIFVDPTVLAET